MKTEKISFSSKDETKLVGVWCYTNNPTSKVIILAHGITADKDEEGIFVDLADTLQNIGFAVFRFDFRGHGESGGKSVDLTITGELFDLEAAIKEVVNKGYREIGLVGASFGGGTATLYSAKHPNLIKALCLWNPALNYDHTFVNPITSWLKNRSVEMKKDLKTKGWTTIGSRKFVVGEDLFEEMKRLYPYEELKKITIPTLIIHGDADTYVPHEDSETYVNNLKNGNLVTVHGAQHGLQIPKEHHDIAINETVKFFQFNLAYKYYG